MNKKLTIGLFIVIIMILIFLYFIVIKSGNSNDRGLKLTEDKIINDPELFNLIVNNHTSPMGNALTKMVLDEDNQYATDESWRYAFYVCTDNEHQGWVYDHNGKTGETRLYGPYGWCLI